MNADKKTGKKIKTDLFRFATLRTPSLISKERRKLGFVEHSSPSESFFLKEITSEKDLAVAKSKLLAVTSNFSPFSSVLEIKQFAGDLWDFSMWLGKNKNNLADITELDRYLGNIKLPSTKISLTIWDNVFYDILTQKNPHVRQACLQLLVAIHFIEHQSNSRDRLKDLKRLAKSRIVIPIVFTAKQSASTKTRSSNEFQQKATQNSSVKRLSKKNEKLMAEEEVKVLLEIKKELTDLGARYKVDYKEAYNKAANAHNSITTKKIEAFLKSEGTKREKIVANADQEKEAIQTIPLGLTPNFTFEYPKTLSKKYTSRKLSFETKQFIEQNHLLESTVSIGLKKLNDQINVQKKSAAQVVKPFPKSILIDGIKLRTNSPYIPAYKINSKPVQTSTGTNLQIYLTFNSGYSNALFEAANFTITLGSKTFQVSTNDLSIIPNNDPEILFVLLKTIPITKGQVSNNLLLSVSGKFQLDNNKSFAFSSKKSSIYHGTEGIAEEISTSVSGDKTTHYGINKIGVADYRKVEQELCCYIPGEVSSIENIMAREYKEKTTRNLIRSEDTLESTVENEIEELNDTTTTTRNEISSEIAHVLEKDRSMNLGFSTGASGTYFGTTFSASMNGDISSSQSSSDSDSISKTYAEDVTHRALERVVQKNTVKRTTKILKEFEENNKHGYDNRDGKEHVTGVFRWVDKVYKNQLVNYGKRLVYEFMLPEPARYYKELIILNEEKKGSDDDGGQIMPEPVNPSVHNILDPSSITRANYLTLASYYGVSPNAPLDEFMDVPFSQSKTVNTPVKGQSFNFQPPVSIPLDYTCTDINGTLDYSWEQWALQTWGFIDLKLGTTSVKWDHPYVDITRTWRNVNINEQVSLTGLVNIDATLLKVWEFNLSLTFHCQLKDSILQQWKQEVYDDIMAAYQQQLTAFNQAQTAANNSNDVDDAAAEEASKLKTNPKYNKQFILNELKRLCIEMMMSPFGTAQGKDFYYDLDLNCGTESAIKIPQYQLNGELDAYSRQVKFFEQALDWSILSHVFYPYYWAKKCEWENLFQSMDSVDHVLQQFLQSGMGRVLVPVREGFEDAVVYYMETGEIWHGTGLVLDTDDELYLSIIDETTIIEGKVEDEWETIVPTSLTLIQGKSAFLDDEGLPCCEKENGSNILTSENVLEIPKSGE